jgi:hypothetical protein
MPEDSSLAACVMRARTGKDHEEIEGHGGATSRRTALQRERCLPSSMTGPVLLRALRPFASNCLKEVLRIHQIVGFVCYSAPLYRSGDPLWNFDGCQHWPRRAGMWIATSHKCQFQRRPICPLSSAD